MFGHFRRRKFLALVLAASLIFGNSMPVFAGGSGHGSELRPG